MNIHDLVNHKPLPTTRALKPKPIDVPSASNRNVEISGVGTTQPDLSAHLAPRSFELHASLQEQLPQIATHAIPPLPQTLSSTLAEPLATRPSRGVHAIPLMGPSTPTPTPIPIRLTVQTQSRHGVTDKAVSHTTTPGRNTAAQLAQKSPHGEVAVQTRVRAAASQIEKLMHKDPPAVRRELENLNGALGLGHMQKNTPELEAAMAEITRCDPVVRAFIMGGCHFYDRSARKSLWRHFLRFQSGRDAPISIEGVVLRRQTELSNSKTRGEALRAMLIHLSWLAPEWPTSNWTRQNDHGTNLRTALQTMVRFLDAAHEDLKFENIQKRVFIEDVKAALVPSCCSLLLCSTITAMANVPLWLKEELQSALPVIAAGSATAIFPQVVDQLPLNMLETRHRADTPPSAGTKRTRDGARSHSEPDERASQRPRSGEVGVAPGPLPWGTLKCAIALSTAAQPVPLLPSTPSGQFKIPGTGPFILETAPSSFPIPGAVFAIIQDDEDEEENTSSPDLASAQTQPASTQTVMQRVDMPPAQQPASAPLRH